MTDKTLDNWKYYLREEHNKPKYKGAGCIIFCPDKDCMLLIRRSEGSFNGELASTGGGVEGEETPFQTAIRETIEEVGKDLSGHEPLNEHEDITEDGIHLTFLMGSIDEFPCSLNSEHDAWGWIDIDEVKMAINRKSGRLISNNFFDREGKKIEVDAKIHSNTIDALKEFNL